jgi:dipeptidyl aminopeptidase/acylaminoacyl peptidase
MDYPRLSSHQKNRPKLLIRSASCGFKHGTAVRVWGRVVTLSLVAFAADSAAFAALTGPTVAEVVEFTRIVQPSKSDNENGLQSVRSPDRRRAFIVTMRGNLATNRNRSELLLLDTDPFRLETGRTLLPQTLVSAESPPEERLLFPPIMEVRWVGNSRIVFRAQLKGSPFQVYSIDVLTRRLTQLTFSQKPIWSFRVSDDLKRVVYTVMEDSAITPLGAESVVVGNLGPQYVLFYPRAQRWRYRYFVAETSPSSASRALGEPFFSGGPPSLTAISPDGQWTLLKVPETDAQRVRAWIERYPRIARWLGQLPTEAADPLRYFAPSDNFIATKLMLYRLTGDGHARPVFDAPHGTRTAAQGGLQDQLWLAPRAAGQGSSVIIADTFLPIEQGGESGENTGPHVIEYWPDSGKWNAIAKVNAAFEALYPAPDDAGAFVMIDGGKRRGFQRDGSGKWSEGTETLVENVGRVSWTLRISEELNQPARVVATGPTGQIVDLTGNLNPRFSSQTWGVARPFSWKDGAGRQWDGGLITPAGLDLTSLSRSPAKLPLVIQTYGFDARHFYLDGPNTVDVGFSSAFAGRAFLREGMLVLQMPWRPAGEAASSSRDGIRRFIDGVIGAISALVEQGLVDKNRIGIIGFSATGGRVQQLLTFSDAPIRAATIADGVSNSLWAYVAFSGWDVGSTLDIEAVSAAKPFGEAAIHWAARDPSLTTHCVTAALRIEAYGRQVNTHWDTYALLRRQYKPAEMIFFPDGAHNLARPNERMISLQGNVDWFRFWLKGEERKEHVIPGETQASLDDQYKRWREMAELKVADDRKPRCALNRGIQ